MIVNAHNPVKYRLTWTAQDGRQEVLSGRTFTRYELDKIILLAFPKDANPGDIEALLNYWKQLNPSLPVIAIMGDDIGIWHAEVAEEHPPAAAPPVHTPLFGPMRKP